MLALCDSLKTATWQVIIANLRQRLSWSSVQMNNNPKTLRGCHWIWNVQSLGRKKHLWRLEWHTYPTECNKAAVNCSGSLASKLLVHNAAHKSQETVIAFLKLGPLPMARYDAPQLRIRRSQKFGCFSKGLCRCQTDAPRAFYLR